MKRLQLPHCEELSVERPMWQGIMSLPTASEDLRHADSLLSELGSGFTPN